MGGQGRACGQTLDVEAAAVRVRHFIGRRADLDTEAFRFALPGGGEDVGVALGGQGLLRGGAFDGHQKMPGDQQDGAEHDGLAVAEIPVGDDPADQRGEVDQGDIGAVLPCGPLVREQELLGQVEDQQAAHAVIGKALPHFRQEQNGETLGVRAQLPEHRRAGDERDQKPRHKDYIHHAALSPRPDAHYSQASPAGDRAHPLGEARPCQGADPCSTDAFRRVICAFSTPSTAGARGCRPPGVWPLKS